MKMVIYGAQGMALGAYMAIKIIQPEYRVECFLVTQKENNASKLMDLPVRELAEYSSMITETEKDEILVFISTPETVMEEIERSLDKNGFKNHVKLDSIRWAKLQEIAFIRKGFFTPLVTYLPGNLKPNINVFKMIHEKDKMLSTTYVDPSYVKRLQVGAAGAEKRIGNMQDDVGDNISKKNGNYSELTGLYWVWKNEIKNLSSDCVNYYGLAHYRRFIELTDDDMTRLATNDIDVVLPYPMPYEPNIEAHHLRYISDDEWAAVLQAVEEVQPEYINGFKKILKQKYMYNYNIILAKAKVLDEYCSWLFPVLFRVEELVNLDGRKMPNRYIGYVGETLETLYFMYNKQRLKIAHNGCRFLI